MLVSSLQREFGFDKPIMTEEILSLFSNFTKAYVFRLIKKALETGELILFSRGVYYLPRNTILGKSKICSEMVAEKKYVTDGNCVYGVYAGLRVLNQFGVTEQVPNVIEIVTNRETTRKRTVMIGDMKYVIRRSRCEIDNTNYAEYTLLQLFSDMNTKDRLDAFAEGQIKEYIKRNGVDRNKLFSMASFFPASTSKKIIQSGVLNGTL